MGVTVIPNGPDPGMQLMSIAMGVKDLQRQSMENALLAAKRDLIPLQTKLMQNQVEASDFALALEKQFGPRDRELGQQSALAGIDQSNAAVRASNSQVKYRNFATNLQRDQFEYQVGIQNAELAMAQDRAVQQRDLFNAQIESQRALGLLQATEAKTGLAAHQRIQAMAESDNPLFRKAGIALLMMGANGGDPSQAYITTRDSDGKEVTLTLSDVVGAWVEQELTGKAGSEASSGKTKNQVSGLSVLPSGIFDVDLSPRTSPPQVENRNNGTGFVTPASLLGQSTTSGATQDTSFDFTSRSERGLLGSIRIDLASTNSPEAVATTLSNTINGVVTPEFDPSQLNSLPVERQEKIREFDRSLGGHEYSREELTALAAFARQLASVDNPQAMLDSVLSSLDKKRKGSITVSSFSTSQKKMLQDFVKGL